MVLELGIRLAAAAAALEEKRWPSTALNEREIRLVCLIGAALSLSIFHAETDCMSPTFGSTPLQINALTGLCTEAPSFLVESALWNSYSSSSEKQLLLINSYLAARRDTSCSCLMVNFGIVSNKIRPEPHLADNRQGRSSWRSGSPSTEQRIMMVRTIENSPHQNYTTVRE